MGLFRKNKEEKLSSAIFHLEDAVWEYEVWSALDNPSEKQKKKERIKKYAQKVFDLGGDPQQYVSVKYKDLMPEVL